jgi:hypothetical protein
MPHYFFNLRTSRGVERDEEGLTFPDLDTARSDAQSCLYEMLADATASGRDTSLQGIDITDGRGTVFAAVNVGDPTKGQTFVHGSRVVEP